MANKLSSLGEFGLIDVLKRSLPLDKHVIKGIGDDTAVLPFNHHSFLLLTTDMMVEDVHFTRKASAEGIGYKALACNISDIAAMGGLPTYAVVSLGIPADLKVSYIEHMYRGMQALASQFGVSVVGGDTVKSQKIVINIALLGEVKKKHLVLRSGARPGDQIFVSGPLGGSLKSGRHISFMPRVAQARFLVKNFKPNAMMDISDGLAGDLNHILTASQVGARLDESLIPKNFGVTLKQALSDGEDYELLFTLNPVKAKALIKWQQNNKKWSFYPIGQITKNPKQRISAQSFIHF